MDTDSVKFSAVGDITLGDHPLCTGFGAFSRFRKEDSLFPFMKTLDVFQRSEILFGNLECAHSWVGLKRGNFHSVQMRGDPRHIQALARAKFAVINVANNHSMQHGNEAFRDTIQQLERQDILCCGISADTRASSAKPVIIQRNGLAVGFLGYSLRPRQYFDHTPLYAEGEPELMVRDVLELRRQSDAVVVSLHWGDEFIQRPSLDDVRLARRLVDAGAHLIIGHHPHVLRGIERRGQGCIVYSLGNFICDMIWDESLRTSLVFECTITRHGIKDVNLVPTYTNDDYQPEVLTGRAAVTVLRHVDKLGQEFEAADRVDHLSASQRYVHEADTVHRRIRAKSHRFFLSRFWRHPSPIVIQQLATYFKTRFHEQISGC